MEEQLEYLEYTYPKQAEVWFDSLTEREQLELTSYCNG
jgi:hypothetical protein